MSEKDAEYTESKIIFEKMEIAKASMQRYSVRL